MIQTKGKKKKIMPLTLSISLFHKATVKILYNLRLCYNILCIMLLFSCSVIFATPWTVAHQASLSFTISRASSNAYPLRWWYHPTSSSSVISFSSCLLSFPATGSFLMSQIFETGGQSIGASASVLPINIQGWFSLGLTGLISLLYKGFSAFFSSTTFQKHQFFSAHPHLWSKSHMHTGLLEKP